jgi:hypothetical protein
MAKIPRQVVNFVNKKANDMLKKSIEVAVTERVLKIRTQIVNDFMNHPVTEEIMNGANASNSSGTLGGYGNLFSFIGFEASYDPISPIIDELNKISINFVDSNNSTVAIIAIPSSQDIFNASPMPWAAGRSWAKGIESGISGLGFYIQRYGIGRSEAGIQTKTKIQTSKFKNTKYISALLFKYQYLINSIDNSQIKIQIQ